MNTLMEWLAQYGLAFAFFNVLAEQIGLPVPAYPVLVVTGALSVEGRYSWPALLAVAVAACLIADLAWYAAGRRHGSKVLRTICRISISPDSCVRQTESLFERWGIWSLLVAKFIPGFATLATALAGNMRLPLAAFIAVDTLGATLFAGVGIGLGVIFHTAVDDILEAFESLGRIGLVLIVGALVFFLVSRWWQRKRLLRQLRSARITVPELQVLIGSGSAPAIIDVRSAGSRQRDGAIPGAQTWPAQAGSEVPTFSRDMEVIVYCACPNEVSAAKVARQLQRAGFHHVRPLLGGIDAWIAAGLPVERSSGD
ncbi:MAG: VTT domain-containing protein [Chitinophagaceae bacterium]|nr:VTT domain-containing protein [Rubrivivax sp.]